ncbi:MAG: putative signal transducing protein [Acidobacteriota bacterium]
MSRPDPNLKLVAILETDNLVFLDLAQAALEDAGVDFAVTEPAPPEFGLSPLVNPASRILVAEKDVPRAREVLAELPAEKHAG